MAISLVNLGRRVRMLRVNKSMTQDELAEQSGLSTKYIGELERGQSNPTLLTVDKIATALDVEMTDPFEIKSDALSVQELRREIDMLLDNSDEKTLKAVFSLLSILME